MLPAMELSHIYKVPARTLFSVNHASGCVRQTCRSTTSGYLTLKVSYVQAEERFEEHPLYAAVAAAKQDVDDAEEHH